MRGLFAIVALLFASFPVAAQGKRQPPSKQLERFSNMSPEERQKALANLPPQRRERIEKQLQRYGSLPPEQKERMNRRLDTLQSLAPERRLAVREELQRLRDMPFRERRQTLMSEEEQAKFSPTERQLLIESFPRIAAEQQKK